MIYYKVVAENKKGEKFSRASYSQNLVDNNLVKRYHLNRWTHTNNLNRPLMVFDTLHNAKEHMSGLLDYSLYECEVKNPRERGIFYAIDVLWTKQLLTDRPPIGTIFCDSVKLLRKIV